MNGKGYAEIRVDVKDAEIVEKLDILRLERGISSNSFIIQAIAEKLRREGYLQNGICEHVPKPKKREMSDIEQLRRSLQKISMRKPE